jgi:hypothetical protein
VNATPTLTGSGSVQSAPAAPPPDEDSLVAVPAVSLELEELVGELSLDELPVSEPPPLDPLSAFVVEPQPANTIAPMATPTHHACFFCTVVSVLVPTGRFTGRPVGRPRAPQMNVYRRGPFTT